MSECTDMVKHQLYFSSSIGMLCMEDDGDAVTGLRLETEKSRICSDPSSEPSVLLRRAKEEIDQYFRGQRKTFDIPIRLEGTAFQKKVWEALRQIPYGETRSYGEIAAAVGNPKACRAVGGANNKNPVLLLVPCHRVIGKNGSLVGFGCGLEAKQILLELEKKNKQPAYGTDRSNMPE